MNHRITYREASRADVSKILYFIRLLAKYEKLEQEVTASEAVLEEWIFDRHSAYVMFVCEEHRGWNGTLFFQFFHICWESRAIS